MTVTEKIDGFRANIYFLNQQELQKEYIDIIEEFVQQLDLKYAMNNEIQMKKLAALESLFDALKMNDYVLMADTLLLLVPPLLGE